MASLIAHQLLCTCITADVHMSGSRCASVMQVLEDELLHEIHFLFLCLY